MSDGEKIVKVIKGKEKVSGATWTGDLSVDALETRGVIKGDLFAASAKAKEILQKAQQEAEEIIRQAVEQREKEKQDGYQAGYQEGLAQVTELLAKARLDYEEALKKASNDMLQLAFKIAEKIIGKQLEMDQKVIMDIVKQALQTVRQSKQITLRVHPEDARLLKANKEEFLELLGHSRVVDILDDPKVQKGGCLIESELGIVDARLNTQLERLKKVLLARK